MCVKGGGGNIDTSHYHAGEGGGGGGVMHETNMAQYVLLSLCVRVCKGGMTTLTGATTMKGGGTCRYLYRSMHETDIAPHGGGGARDPCGSTLELKTTAARQTAAAEAPQSAPHLLVALQMQTCPYTASKRLFPIKHTCSTAAGT
jgi:hypothetical protein